MKKIFLSNILIVFGVFFMQAQSSRLDSVIIKFQGDNRSFEEFILLGKMVCYSDVFDLEDNYLYSDIYIKLYNSLTPFTRLLKEQSIKNSIEEYFLLNIKYFETKKEESQYYEKIKLCDCLFNKNEDYKKQYLQLISDKENYLSHVNNIDSFSWEEIESFRKDYLDNYFIKVLTE